MCHADSCEGAFWNDLFKEIIKEKQLGFTDMKYRYWNKGNQTWETRNHSVSGGVRIFMGCILWFLERLNRKQGMVVWGQNMGDRLKVQDKGGRDVNTLPPWRTTMVEQVLVKSSHKFSLHHNWLSFGVKGISSFFKCKVVLSAKTDD